MRRIPKHRGNRKNIRGISKALNNFPSTHLLAIRFFAHPINLTQGGFKSVFVNAYTPIETLARTGTKIQVNTSIKIASNLTADRRT